jgi:hypothetical protein
VVAAAMRWARQYYEEARASGLQPRPSELLMADGTRGHGAALAHMVATRARTKEPL